MEKYYTELVLKTIAKAFYEATDSLRWTEAANADLKIKLAKALEENEKLRAEQEVRTDGVGI